jgi:hypothetical protein
MTSRSVVDEEPCPAKRLQNLLGLDRGQALTYAGIATLIFSFTGSETNFGSLGMASPSLRKLSR